MKPRPLFANPRTMVFRAAILIAFGVLAFQLWQLQILRNGEFRAKANTNRSRLLDVDAPRGVMYDRYGRLFVRNRPAFNVAIVPADLPIDTAQEEGVLTRLANILAGGPATSQAQTPLSDTGSAPAQSPGLLSVKEIQKKVAEGRHYAASQPIIVATSVDQETAFVIEESLALPGIYLQVVPVRDYLTGSLTGHIIGYTGRIPQEDADRYKVRGYGPQDQVGRTGLELAYEEELRGTKGRKHSIVDANGREMRTIGQTIPAVPGRNLVLTLDLELQTAMEKALQYGLEAAKSQAGVAIAMDPRNGDILGLVSLPKYDNRLFAQGISADEYTALITDPLFPLFDRAIGGVYPPGSTFKIIPASAGLQEGVISRRTLLHDPGVIWLPNRYFPDDPKQAQAFVCWTWKYGYGHGRLSVTDALAQSCDVFFYQVGGGFKEFQGLGEKTLADYARLFGLGAMTGVDVPGENSGLVPDARWKRLQYGETWVTGDTYNMSIGQGAVLVTPLQMLNAMAAVANGGYLYRPRLVSHLTDADGKVVRTYSPFLIRELPIEAQNLAIVREGLYGAVNWSYGTATLARLPTIAVAGKTGTAEYPGKRDAKGNLPTHAWFAAFAPYEEPEIALIVMIEGGGEGSATAAPVAAEVLRSYFYGEEPRPIPTATPATRIQ